jgi:hypothetical protein
MSSPTLHCKDDPIYVFPDMKLHSLDLNSHIHASVNDLYIPRIGVHNMPAKYADRSLECINRS